MYQQAEAIFAIKQGDVSRLNEILKHHGLKVATDGAAPVVQPKNHWINQLLPSEDFDKSLLSIAIGRVNY